MEAEQPRDLQYAGGNEQDSEETGRDLAGFLARCLSLPRRTSQTAANTNMTAQMRSVYRAGTNQVNASECCGLTIRRITPVCASTLHTTNAANDTHAQIISMSCRTFCCERCELLFGSTVTALACVCSVCLFSPISSPRYE